RSGVRFLTVHGSNPVMRAAMEGRGAAPVQLLAVTVLTSFDEEDLTDLGYPCPVEKLVSLRVRNAMELGMDGIVGSPVEAKSIRAQMRPGALLITPGVRSGGSAADDQKRIATPLEAIRDGADYVVIGRQVTRAEDPALAVRQIREEMAGRLACNTSTSSSHNTVTR